MRDAAYRASVALAAEKGAFPLFDAEAVSRLRHGEAAAGGDPRRDPRRAACATAICCRSRPPAPSASPSPTMPRTASSRPIPGSTPGASASRTAAMREYRVEDHAWRLWRARGGNTAALPPAFVSALEISARDHMAMQAAIQPFIDAAISKTVNVPVDYPFEEFETLYLDAWRAGLKGITTYRPNNVLGAVLSLEKRGAAGSRPVRARPADPDQRRAAGGAGGAALAAPAEAGRGVAVLDLYGRGAGEPLRGLRRPCRERRQAAVRGLGQRRADAARAGGAGQEPLDGHAGAGPGVAEAEARQPGQDPRRAVHRGDAAGRGAGAGRGQRQRLRQGGRASLRGARGLRRRRRARRRWSMRCSRARSRSRAWTAR